MSDIRDILADNLALLMARSRSLKTQNSLAKHSQNLGEDRKVGQTTIGNILRAKEDKSLPFPKLDTIENLAKLFGIEVSDLLSPNLTGAHIARLQPLTNSNLSPQSQEIVTRLQAAESSGASSPQLIVALKAVLDLAAPQANPDGYRGLDKLPME